MDIRVIKVACLLIRLGRNAIPKQITTHCGDLKTKPHLNTASAPVASGRKETQKNECCLALRYDGRDNNVDPAN